MNDAAAVARFIEGHRPLMRVLGHVAALDLPDCWVAAGAIRAAVWDELHGFGHAGLRGDVDVIFFDPRDAAAERDAEIEVALRVGAPEHPWSVKNQARMHVRNGDPPYRHSAHAMTHWPETCTAVAARFASRKVELLAPFGLEDLLGLVVRPTPWSVAHKQEVYRARALSKRWADTWPLVRVTDCSPTLSLDP
jgi:hypothetical protein